MKPNVNKEKIRFERMTIISFDVPLITGKSRMVLAKCDCGVIKKVRLGSLYRGEIKSCGCYRRDHPAQKTHGLSRTRVYKIYKGIKGRCYNKNSDSYKKWYGAKGVEMCAEWRNNFMAFYNWSMKNGYSADKQIDRFPDGKGMYSPDNCRWATPKQNSQNRPQVKVYRYKGKNFFLSELSDLCGIRKDTIYSRITVCGWTVKKAVETPLISGNPNHRPRNASITAKEKV